MRWLAGILALAGCAPVDDQLQKVDGTPVDVAWVFLQPLCLILCNTNLTTSGSDVDTIGDSATGSASQSQAVTSQAGGA